MSERLTVALISGLMSVVSLAALIIYNQPIVSHVRDLKGHLSSGDWSVSGGDASVDQMIQAKFRQPSREWSIAYLAGSGRAYPLDDISRGDTIAQLGDYRYRSNAIANQNMARISSYYLSLVSQSARGAGIDQAIWSKAKVALDAFSDDLGNEGEAFPVDTNPSLDDPESWNLKAIRLPQSSRCTGVVSGLRSKAAHKADFSLQPRYVALPIIRDWFTPALLEQAAESPQPAIRDMVVGDGPLSEIPMEIWIRLPTGITITTLDEKDMPALKSLVTTADCCRVECLGLQTMVAPGTATPLTDGSVLARLTGPPMTVYAIISQRQRYN